MAGEGFSHRPIFDANLFVSSGRRSCHRAAAQIGSVPFVAPGVAVARMFGDRRRASGARARKGTCSRRRWPQKARPYAGRGHRSGNAARRHPHRPAGRHSGNACRNRARCSDLRV